MPERQSKRRNPLLLAFEVAQVSDLIMSSIDHTAAAATKVARAFQRVKIVKEIRCRFHTLESVCHVGFAAAGL